MSNWVTKADLNINGDALSHLPDIGVEDVDAALKSNSWIGSYNVVGINANHIPTMRQAIKDYVDNIMLHIDGINPLLSADGAFKSEEVQDSVKAYLTKVKESCENYISKLLVFSDKLQSVYEAYQANINKVSGNYNQMASLIDSGTRYTEKK